MNVDLSFNRTGALCLGIMLLGCESTKAEDTSLPFNEGPVFTYTLPTDRFVQGDKFEFSISVEDENGIEEVVAYYRKTGSIYWETLSLWAESDETTNVTAVGELADLQAPGLEFYFKATDRGTPQALSFYPGLGPEEPLSIDVSPASLPLPFFEDFELQDDEANLIEIDWWTPSDARDTYAFDHTGAKAYSGDFSVYHPAGSATSQELSDWLISPPLDFSEQTGVMVSWWEASNNISENSVHGLYVSTGSRLPSDGDYVSVSEVLELPSSSEWSRHKYIDLTEWAGQPLVYLAWRWQGTLADEWFLDDISVRALGPDFSAIFASSPEVVNPGDTVQFTAQFDNVTAGAADSVLLDISLPEGGGVLSEAQVDLGAVAGNDSITANFSVVVDETIAENRYLPIAFSLTDGQDSWSFQERLLIGQPSYANVAFELYDSATVDIVIGVGDPSQPVWSKSLYTGLLDSGPHSLNMEVTDQFEYLPPQAGENRWFLSFESNQLAEVQSFSLNYGDTQYTNSNITTVFDVIPAELLLPRPPEPSIFNVSPSSFSPGDTDVPLSINLYNTGAASQGPISVQISSAHPDVTVTGGEEYIADSTIWNSQELLVLNQASVSIASSHVDSLPVLLSIDITDGVDSWQLPLELDVPWPVLKVVGVNILDGDDGILDPDETAELEIYISNVGDMNAFGYVYGTLSLEDTSTASATVENNNPSFGFMDVGDSEDEDDFAITVTGGTAGETLDLRLTMNDNAVTYTDTFQLVLGEAPWFALSSTPDDVGDPLDSSQLDLYFADYRVVDDNFELRIESATVINPSTAFLEIWGEGVGADYAYYRWVVQAGVATMQGYNGGVGFLPIGNLDVDFVNDYQMILRWSLADMGLGQNALSFGFASGWCGPPEYFCDHYPNGWGYPYVTFSSGLWLTANF